MNRFYRIIAGYHDQVCRIEIHCYAGGIKGIQESTQCFGCFRTCLNREMRIDRIRILRQFTTCVLHDTVTRMLGILRHDTDMRRYDISPEFFSCIQDTLGSFDKIGIELGVSESVAKVSAYC